MERPTLSPLGLKLFYHLERVFFGRLVIGLGQDQERMKVVIALWLWLESIGLYDFVRHVAGYPDEIVLRFVAEAEACINRLLGIQNPNRGDELPLTNSLAEGPITLRFFDTHWVAAINGVRHNMQTVCQIIFEDVLP